MAKKKKKDKNLQRKRKKEKAPKKNKTKASAMYRRMNDQASLYGCWINRDYNSSGVAYIIIARKMVTGLLMFASFYLDTVNGIVEDCFGSINITEDYFQKTILGKDGPDFFHVELELAKDIIADVIYKSKEKQREINEEFYPCLKLVGSVEEYIKRREKPLELAPEYVKIYEITDSEKVETELRQLPMLEESEDSVIGHRKFEWWEAKSQGLFRKKGTKKNLGQIILEPKKLTIQAKQDQDLQYIQDSLLQYLGTCID